MNDTIIPTNVRQAWRAGAEAEAKIRNEGLTNENRQLRDYLEAMARNGSSKDDIIETFVRVYASQWFLRRRLALIWQLVRG